MFRISLRSLPRAQAAAGCCPRSRSSSASRSWPARSCSPTPSTSIFDGAFTGSRRRPPGRPPKPAVDADDVRPAVDGSAAGRRPGEGPRRSPASRRRRAPSSGSASTCSTPRTRSPAAPAAAPGSADWRGSAPAAPRRSAPGAATGRGRRGRRSTSGPPTRPASGSATRPPCCSRTAPGRPFRVVGPVRARRARTSAGRPRSPSPRATAQRVLLDRAPGRRRR